MKLKSKGIFKNLSAMFLLLIVVIAICVPFKEVNAAGWPSIPSVGDLISFDIFSIIIEFIADAAADEDSFLWPIYFLVYQFFNICLLCVTILVYFGAWLVDVFLDEDIYARVLDMTDKTSAVYIGWTTVRDACNTFFILFFLLIAFSTILRIQAYNAKNLLPKLIISLFLINFSAIIAMMVIDLGQVFMFEIKTWMGAGFSEGGRPLTSIIDYFNSEYNFESPTEKYLLSDVVGVAFAVAYSLILGLLYIMLALFLMVRIVVFVILVIVSPFAFFSIILPGMRTYTSQWWSSLVSHAIFGPIFLFFIFLSGKMAQSMQTFEPIEPNDEISSLSYIIAELIPHVVALALLAAAIPVTQKLGAAGSSKIIGGAAGMGKVGIGVVAGAKLAGGLGKKVGGGTAGRAHSALKGGVLGERVAKGYNKAAEKVGGGIKSLPIVGRISIEHEAGKAEKKKEAIAKHEKILESRTDKDKKKYVDSFKLDKNAQAEAKQAMFNVLAKDNGAGLTNKNLQKMGYEKEVAGKMVFDEKKFNKDYGQVVAHGHDTSKIETYRPDLINDKVDRLEKIDKIAADGNEKSIKLATLADPEMDKRLRKAVGNTRYNNLINSKMQAEKDDLAEIKENQITRGLTIASVNKNDKDALDITEDEGKEELFRQQTDIAYLTGTEDKAEKMKKIKGTKMDKKKGYLVLDYEDEVDPKVADNVVNRMNTDELIDQDPQFLEDTSHMIKETSQFSRINKNKNVTTGQSEAIKKSIGDRMKVIKGIKKHEEEYERLEKAARIMGSSITKPDKKKKSSGSEDGGGGEDKNKRGKGKDQSTFDNFGGGDDEEETVSTDLISNKSRRSILKDESTSMDSAGGESSDTDDEQSFLKEITEVQRLRNKNKERDEDQKSRNNMPEYRETIEKLEELAGKEGLGISISGKKEHSIGVPSFGISKVGYSKDGEKKESTIFTEKDKDEVFMDPKTISNIKELFKTDKKFGEGGMTSIMEHEKQHLEGQASKSAKKEESELKKYSKKKGVSFEDVKKKKDELHDKYYAGEETQGAGYELQTEVQRGIKGFKDVNDFVESKARMQVVTDVVHGGMDNLGKMKYGSEDPGFDDTHSRFIKQDVLDKITERMEVMRQDLVAKHNAKKGVDSGDDEASVEGMDDFMTGSGKGGAKSKTTKTETEPRSEKTGVKKAVDSYKKYADKSPSIVAGKHIKKKIIDPAIKTYKEKMPAVEAAVGKAEIAGLKAVGTVRPTVRVANKVILPILDEGVKASEEKMAGANISNQEMRSRMAKRLKTEVKPIISKNADKGVDAIGDGAEEALNKAAENATGKTKIALKTASAVAGNKHVRRAVSKKAQRLADQDEGQTVDEHPATKTDTKPKSGASDKYPDSNDGAKENIKKPEEQSGNKRIKKFAGTMNEIGNMTMKGVAGRRGKDPVAETKMAMKVVDIASKLDKRAAIVKPVADVLLEKQLEIDKRRQGGEKISQLQEDKEKFGALKESLKKIIPKDSKNDGKYIEEVGKLLSELGKEKGGKAGAVMTGAGTVLQSEKAQEVISKEVRKKADKEEDEKPEAKKRSVETAEQAKSKSVPKQWKIKETEEKIIEVKESVSKDGLKSTAVKSEITFDPTNISEEWSEQIKGAMKGMSNDMEQKITNNIAVNSSQEAPNIDFEKIIDVNKIAELVEKGINMKDVEKNLKDVKKSFDKFKENNSGNANTTVFGAGISAAQTAIGKAQMVEDHKKQAVELATISGVIGEIKSRLKKQDKPSGEGEK